MNEALLFFTVSSSLIIAVASLVVAGRALRIARRYVKLAEKRMERAREGQDRLLEFLQEEHQRLKEELKQEREQRVEAQQQTEQKNRQEVYASGREGSSPLAEDSLEATPERDTLVEEPLPAEKAPETRGTPPPAHHQEVADAGASKAPMEDEKEKKAGFVVWHPHPDDDVSPGGVSSSRPRGQDDVPIKMFRKHYERYLENYEGYVKLAEGIYQMRDEGEVPPGSPAEREWVERLRRINDGIARTTARLDILEQSNPELATDERVSRRASIARAHLKLDGKI